MHCLKLATIVLIFCSGVLFGQNKTPVQILDPGLTRDSDFGWDLEVRGDFMIVGARYDDGVAAPNDGSAFIYQKDEQGLWILQQKIVAPDPEARAFFGWSVSITQDGQTAVVGAHFKDYYHGDGTSSSSLGAAYIYNYSNQKEEWEFSQKLTPEILRYRNKFGEVVHLDDSGTNLFVTEDGGVSWYQQIGGVYSFITSVEGTSDQLNFGRNLHYENGLLSAAAPYTPASQDIRSGAIEVLFANPSSGTIQYSQRLLPSAPVDGDLFSWSTSSSENFIAAASTRAEPNIHLFKLIDDEYILQSDLAVPVIFRIGALAVTDSLLAYSSEWDRDNDGGRDGNIIRILQIEGNSLTIVDSIYTAVGQRIQLGLGEMKIRDNQLYAGAIDDGGGTVHIYDITPPTLQINIYDANPKFINLGFLGLARVDSIQEITDVKELAQSVLTKRETISADGATKVLVSIPFSEPFNDISIEINKNQGSITYPWGHNTHDIDGHDMGYILYEAPDVLPNEQQTISNGIKSVTLSLLVRANNGNDENKELQIEIPLLRPPVVLVHGTFDNPDNCWKTPIKPSANTMVQALELNNFKVFTLDYQSSNGAKDVNLIALEPTSSFQSNKKVVYSNPGGIADAIAFYRDNLNAAGTRADVVGHSMGGVLPRVLASDDPGQNRYNDDYYRSENFNRGDINRLITIASTHHGSDLSYFQHFFSSAWSNSELPLHERLSHSALPIVALIAAGKSETGAVRDQVPGSLALRKIGPTPIPAHAIVCSVPDINAIESNSGEPEQFATYANLLKAATAFFYFYKSGLRSFLINMLRSYKRLPPHLQNGDTLKSPFPDLSRDITLASTRPKDLAILIQQIDDGFTAFWQDWHLLLDSHDDSWYVEEPEYLLQYETAEYQPFDDDDFIDFVADKRLDIISGEYLNTDFIQADKTQSAIDYLRYLIFKNDLNDGVVRYQSQTGDLDDPYISHFDNHIHSYVQRDPDVINRVVSLLSSGLGEFALDGFPHAGRLMPIAIPDPDFIAGSKSAGANEHRHDCEAACWSGMVPEHAFAFAEVAADLDVVILSRPVNPDATELIRQGAATKGMNLKGKSSNWGPHKGYIPVAQRYSKLWNLYGDNITKRDSQIIEFTQKTTEQLKESPDEAVRRHLQITFDCGGQEKFKIYYKGQTDDAEQEVFLIQQSASGFKIFQWDPNGSETCPIIHHDVVSDISAYDTMYVMAQPGKLDEEGKPRYYTADYDLLAIGFKVPGLAGWEDDPYQVDTLKNFDKQKGLITPKQRSLLDDLNAAVQNTGYDGGDVSHHGPENQFYILDNPKKGSPYVDYPITAFYREDGKGKILGIPRGEVGHRDVYLKHFMARMRRQGYDLYENIASPGWDWSKKQPYTYTRGWHDQDVAGLDYGPEEIPFDESSCDCPGKNKSTKGTDLTALEYNSTEQLSSLIYPNPSSEFIHLTITSTKHQVLTSTIMNTGGQVLSVSKKALEIGKNNLTIEVANYAPGTYFLLLQNDLKTVTKKFIVSR